MCKIKMIGAEISKVNVYPGERLYVNTVDGMSAHFRTIRPV